ncbi:MAG: winged helix-turn-helix domain-containing protein [Pyrobaculum sp.]
MDISAGVHEVYLGPWIPGFYYKVFINLNGSASVSVFVRDFALYAQIETSSPVSLNYSVMYFPLVPLAVVLYLVFFREEFMKRLVALGLPLYSRMVKPRDFLANPRRGAVYDFIKKRGYSWPREIERVFNMAYGEVQWHLSLLERAGLVYSFYALRRRFYVDHVIDFFDAVMKVYREQAGREPTDEEMERAEKSCAKRR